MNPNTQELYNVIAILVEKLGGEVTITQAERVTPPEGIVSTNPDGSVTIKVVKR